MKERSVNFCDWEVRASMAERTNQFRRAIKPQPLLSRYGWTYTKSGRLTTYGAMLGRIPFASWDEDETSPDINTSGLSQFCPYGAPGDLLWVREGFAHDPHEHCDEWNCGLPSHIYYRAEETNNSFDAVRHWKWRPSVHMPRWASRITLRVTDVRVEQVRGTSEADARTEGWEWVVRCERLAAKE